MLELLARYDGVHFIWTNLPSRAVQLKAYPAESGQIGYQNASYQGVKDKGPIVEGEYTAQARINPTPASFLPTSDERQACRLAVAEGIQSIRLERHRLQPVPGQRPQLRIVPCGPAIGAWGEYRWRLSPDAATRKRMDEFGREGGFHLHGGGPLTAGTSGCIKLPDDFWADALTLLRTHEKTLQRMRLTVKYPSREARTGARP